MRYALTAGLVTILSVVGGAEAQTSDGPRGSFDLAFVGAQPKGDFGLIVDQGWGVELGGRYELDHDGLLSLRGSLGFINYGHERLRFCSVYSCRVGIDLDTQNNIVFFGVGPELAIQMGPLRPYARAALGIGYFVTTSGLSGDGEFDHTFARTDNFDDFVLQRRLGTGLGLRLSNGRRPVWLDLGVDYHHNGMATYLREGDIVDRPDGSIIISPRRSEANLMTFRLGVSIGVGGDGDHHGDDWHGR